MAKRTVVDNTIENRLPIEGLNEAEDAGVMFDPSNQAMDLTKEEKRRTTSLFLAINAYRELIIKEADYLKEASDLARRGEGPALRPATIDAIVIAALKFDAFIAGQLASEISVKDEDSPERIAEAHTAGEGGA